MGDSPKNKVMKAVNVMLKALTTRVLNVFYCWLTTGSKTSTRVVEACIHTFNTGNIT